MNLLLAPKLLMRTQVIDRTGYTLKLNADSPIVELVIKPDAILDESFVRDTKKILEDLRPDHKYFLLVSSEGFFRLTKKARKMGASKSFSAHLAAVACYTTNFSLALLGELYNKINKPVVPTRVFHSKDFAKEWLMELIAKTNLQFP